MSRVLALFLALTLLLQTSWAVAATYCEHETTPAAARHFGHHAHVHKSIDGQKSPAGKLAVDDDCAGCHAGHPAIVPMGPVDVVAKASSPAPLPQPSWHGSAPARAPDRPQWNRFA